MDPVNTDVSRLRNQTYYKSSSLWSGSFVCFVFKLIFLIKFTVITGRHWPKVSASFAKTKHFRSSLSTQVLLILPTSLQFNENIDTGFLSYLSCSYWYCCLSCPILWLVRACFKMLIGSFWHVPISCFCHKGYFLITFLSSQVGVVAWRYSAPLSEQVGPQPHKDKKPH